MKKISFEENLGYGALFVSFSNILTAPLERVKILVQVQEELLKSQRIQSKYLTIWDCFIKTYKSEGFFSLWKGNFVHCLKFFPSHCLTLLFRNDIKSFFPYRETDSIVIRIRNSMLLGGSLTALISIFVYHFDFVRTRIAADVLSNNSKPRFDGTYDAYCQIYKVEGITGFYRGFVFSTFGSFFYRGIFFSLHELSAPIYQISLYFRLITYYTIIVASGFIAYPFDTVKRRVIVSSSEKRYIGGLDCFIQIIRNEGYYYLMRGAGINFFKSIYSTLLLLAFDIQFVTYKGTHIDLSGV